MNSQKAMVQLTDSQIDFILDDLYRQGIRTEGLRQNLLDHICILIEQNLEEDGDFAAYYASVVPSFYKDELRELEEETHLLLTVRKPFLLLSRARFFWLLFALFLGPFISYDIYWSLGSSPGNGLMLPMEVWGATFVFALFPLLVFLVLLLTPERYDPLVPRGAKILIGWRPIIRVLPANGLTIPG